MFPAIKRNSVAPRRAALGVPLAAAAVVVNLAATGGTADAAAAPGPSAAAASCSDVDVVIARGTGEPGRLGVIVGDPLFSALKSQIRDRSLSSHAVDYPASLAPDSAALGNTELVRHVTAQANSCPDQKFVLVGYSQGANVVDNSIGIDSGGALVGAPIVATIPAAVQPKVAAVLLFGNPIRAVGRKVTGTFEARTLDLCADGDPVCGAGANVPAHLSYGANAGQAASFAAARV